MKTVIILMIHFKGTKRFSEAFRNINSRLSQISCYFYSKSYLRPPTHTRMAISAQGKVRNWWECSRSWIFWDANSNVENWVFKLVEAKNTFNEIDQIIMLWTVCHSRLSGSSFVLNCYLHHYLIVLRERDGTSNIIHIKEGVMQGEPLTMVAYGIGVLLTIKILK